MELLFDETNGFESDYFRTIWYGYFKLSDLATLSDVIVSQVKKDLSKPLEHVVEATQWVFYSEDISEDAIGEKVRVSLMLRYMDNQFICRFNVSDYHFAIMLDTFESFSSQLSEKLNNI